MSDLNTMTADFVGRISVAVWIGRLSDQAACEALQAYAEACREGDRPASGSMRDLLLAEYRRRREGQELCS